MVFSGLLTSTARSCHVSVISTGHKVQGWGLPGAWLAETSLVTLVHVREVAWAPSPKCVPSMQGPSWPLGAPRDQR